MEAFNDMNILKKKLYKDIHALGLPVDFELELRGYSKLYNGLYYPNKCKVVVFTQELNGKAIPYDILLKSVIHEAIHHYQWQHQKGFKRIKGVMHDTMFHRLNDRCVNLAYDLKLISEGERKVV